MKDLEKDVKMGTDMSQIIDDYINLTEITVTRSDVFQHYIALYTITIIGFSWTHWLFYGYNIRWMIVAIVSWCWVLFILFCASIVHTTYKQLLKDVLSLSNNHRKQIHERPHSSFSNDNTGNINFNKMNILSRIDDGMLFDYMIIYPCRFKIWDIVVTRTIIIKTIGLAIFNRLVYISLIEN